ncbi:MAG TPA: ATP-binding protein, partial [Polyangia bacterium]|nr:ATP-binding protein [Polyangia bacterium]
VRRSVVALRSPTADRPLGAALHDLVDETRAAGIDAQVYLRGTVRPLGPNVEFALYRAAQEALTNVRRHAVARSVQLHLGYEGDHVELRIDDDGRGASRMDEGFGLAGVRERIAQVGGTVDVETAASGGFSLRVRVSG